MDYGKNITERISPFLNQPLIIHMKNDISYKGIFRGIGNQRNLVFDLTEKTMKFCVDKRPATFHKEMLKCTEYINPNEIATFVLDVTSNSHNTQPNYTKQQPQFIYVEPQRNGMINNCLLPNSFVQPQCAQLVDPNSQLVDMNGQLINMNGQRVDINGQRGPAWFVPCGLPLPIYAPMPKLLHDQSIQPQLFGAPQQPDKPTYFVNVQPIQAPVSKLVQQQAAIEPIEITNRASNYLANHQSYCQQPAVVTGKVLYEQACSLFGSQSLSVNHNQQVYTNSFNAYDQQSLRINNQFPYEQRSQLVGQHPYYVNIQKNQNHVRPVTATPSILHKYSIAQLMAGIVPTAENFRNEYFQDLQEQSEREFHFQPVLDLQFEVMPNSPFQLLPPDFPPVPKNEPKPNINKPKPLEINNKPNAFSYYLPIDLGLNANSDDKDQLAKKKLQIIELENPRSTSVTKKFDNKNYGNQNEPVRETFYSGFNVSNNLMARTVEPKYRILKRNHHQYHKSILPTTFNSGIPSTSLDDNNIDKMNPKQFEIHLMKSLGSEHASLINMTREEFSKYLMDSPYMKNVERPFQASEKQSKYFEDAATLFEKPTKGEKSLYETEQSPLYLLNTSPDTFEKI